MSEAVQPLGGSAFDGLVHLSEAPLQGMITLRADLSDAAVKKAIKAATGQTMPDIRGASVQEGQGVLWMSPDEAMLLVPYAEVDAALAKLTKSLGKVHALAVNVSDARAMFSLRGPAAREVIAKLAPVDMAPGAFEPGMVRRTRFAQVAGAFWMEDQETIHVVCFRSVARYMFDLLSVASDPASAVDFF